SQMRRKSTSPRFAGSSYNSHKANDEIRSRDSFSVRALRGCRLCGDHGREVNDEEVDRSEGDSEGRDEVARSGDREGQEARGTSRAAASVDSHIRTIQGNSAGAGEQGLPPGGADWCL